MTIRYVSALIASCGGLGYTRWMPGTVGSLGALITHAMLRLFLSVHILVFVGLCLTIVGLWATKKNITSATDDPSWIVIDEWCAVWFLCCALPYAAWSYVLGFLVFRILDIAKLWPVSLAERAPGAWGIFLDDFVAALLAGIFCWQVGRWLVGA